MKKAKVSAQVEELLRENRKSQMTGVTPRDSDKELLIQFMQIHLGMNLNHAQIELIRTVNFESIRRERAKFQERGEYLGSPEVMEKRHRKALNVQLSAPESTPQSLQRRIEHNA